MRKRLLSNGWARCWALTIGLLGWLGAGPAAQAQLPSSARLTATTTDTPVAPTDARDTNGANDECSGATLLTSNTSCLGTSGTTVGATQSLTGINCFGSGDDDVWYRFVATGTAHTVRVVGNGTFDAVLDVRAGSCPGINVSCTDNTLAGGTETVSLTNLTAGATYYVRVYSYGGTTADTGTFSICVTGSSGSACTTPTDAVITATSGTTAQLTFTPLAGNTSFAVTFTPTGGGTTSGTVTGSPVSLTGLTPNTTYTVTLQALCAGGGTASVLSGTFTTLSGTSTVPVNNECTGATLLTSSTSCVGTSGTTVGATQSLTGVNCFGTGDDDVWYRFVATSTTHTVRVVGNGTFDAVLDVRVGSCPGTNVSCTDGANAGGTETVSLTNLTVGASYYVRVYSYGAATTDAGTFSICVTGTATATCTTPTNAQVTATSGTTAQLTFTPQAGNTSFVVTYTPTGGATSSQTFTGSPANLTGLTPGTTYALTIQALCASGGTASVLSGTFTTPAASVPTNNECTGAALLTSNTSCVSTGGTTVGATQSLTGVNCFGTGDDDVWYRFVATGTAHTVTVVGNGTFDAVVEVRTGSCPGTSFNCTDSENAGGTETMSLTSLTVGQTYYVRVYSYGGASTDAGTFTICLTGTTTVPANNECAGAILLTSGTTCVPTSGTTVGATQSLAAVTCGPTGTADDDVWYRFVATSTAHTVTVASSAAFDAVIDVRAGSCPGTNIGCADIGGNGAAETVSLSGLTVGQTYYVRVYSYGGASTNAGTFTICVTNAAAPTCPAVTGLNTSNTTATSNTLTFTPAAGAVGYTVTLTPAGGNPVTIAATGSPVALTGLTPNTSYAVCVTTICSGGGTGVPACIGFNTPAAPCPAVTNQSVSNLTTTSASVSFTPVAGAASYTVSYGPQGGATTTLTAAGSPVNLAGLQPGTVYAVVIRTNCAGGQSSADVVLNFSTATATPCPAVSNLVAGSISATGATLSFTPPATGANAYIVTYTPAGGTTITLTAGGSPVNLTGLQPGTQYTATVTTDCGQGRTSPVVSTTFSTTNPVCNPATNVAAGNLTATSAGVSFTPAAGAVSYTVSVTPAGGSTTTQPATGSPVALSNLQPGTVYTVSIVTTCAAGQTSGAATTTFTTPAPAPTNGTAGSISQTGASLSFTPAAGATSYTVTVTPQGGQGTTLTVTGSPVVLTGLLAGTGYTVTIVANYPGGGTSAPLTTTFGTLLGTRAALAGGIVSVFPNPAHRAFTLSLPALGATRTARLTLVNALGQTVHTQTIALTAGGTQTQVEVASLATGLYTVRVQAGAETATTRLAVE